MFLSPVFFKKPNEFSLSIIIIAPVFDFAIFLQELIITFMSVVIVSFWFLRNLKNLLKPLFLVILVEPNNRRNFLISCWNTTIRAKKPTLINLPNKLLNTVMFNKSVNFQIRYIITIPIKIFIATVPLSNLYK